MAINEEIIKIMDAGAKIAEEEIKGLKRDAVIEVANWWQANYLKAGHKRLGKILLKYAPKEND
jgi:hypothetical protein